MTHILKLQHRSQLESYLTLAPKLTVKTKKFHFFFFKKYFFMIHFFIYLCIYTPSKQHFKAFPVSKINSKTSFLYQLFKKNSNFIHWKQCKVIYLSIFYYFHYYLLYIYSYVYLCIYTHLHINILKPSRCLNPIPRQVFCINFSRRIQIS